MSKVFQIRTHSMVCMDKNKKKQYSSYGHYNRLVKFVEKNVKGRSNKIDLKIKKVIILITVYLCAPREQCLFLEILCESSPWQLRPFSSPLIKSFAIRSSLRKSLVCRYHIEMMSLYRFRMYRTVDSVFYRARHKKLQCFF